MFSTINLTTGKSNIDVKKLAKDNPDEFLNLHKDNIAKAVNKYSGSGVDKAVLTSKAEAIALDSAKNFDKSFGVKFETHLFDKLKSLYREVNNMQGIARISENNKLNYNNDKENKVFNRKQNFNSGIAGDEMSNVDSGNFEHEFKKILISAPLAEKERELVDHLYGLNGKKVTTDSGELKKILSINDSRLSTLKSRIAKKVAPSIARMTGTKRGLE